MGKEMSLEEEKRIQGQRMSFVTKALKKAGWVKIGDWQHPLDYPECVQFRKEGRYLYVAPQKENSVGIEIWEAKALRKIDITDTDMELAVAAI